MTNPLVSVILSGAFAVNNPLVSVILSGAFAVNNPLVSVILSGVFGAKNPASLSYYTESSQRRIPSGSFTAFRNSQLKFQAVRAPAFRRQLEKSSEYQRSGFMRIIMSPATPSAPRSAR